MKSSKAEEVEQEPEYQNIFNSEFQITVGDKIIAKNLSKKYKKANDFAVKNISFELNESETLGIIGPSGAGKSTIFKIMSTMINRTNGQL